MPRHARYSDDDIVRAVANSQSVMGVMRELGIRMAGGSHSHISRRIEQLGLDTTHFTRAGWNIGNASPARKGADQILVIRTAYGRVKIHQLRRALDEIGRARECAGCGLGEEWQGKPLVLEVDHIDNDYLNNLPDNLQYLCPNCHSQKASPRGGTHTQQA